jgi:capsular polysaccharide transport system permease protein
MATERWLDILTQLSVQGDYRGVVARSRDHLDALDASELALVARAALEVGDEETLDAAVNRLRALAPEAGATRHLELCRAVHRDDRSGVAEVQRRISDYAALVNQPVLRKAAGLHLRAHAWTDLEDLLARCRAAVDDLPPGLARAQAVVSLRRRAYTDAVSQAQEAYQKAGEEEKLVSGVLLARCLEHRGLGDRAALTYRQVLWNAAAERRHHYRGALAAVKVGRYPMARHFMQRATNAGADGPWIDWIRGHVQLRFQSAEKALEIFRQLCEREPDNVAFAIAWLDAFDADQPPSRTLEHLDRMLERIDSPELRVRRTDLLLAIGRVEEAQREIDAALDSFPASQPLRDMRDRVASASVDGNSRSAVSTQPPSEAPQSQTPIASMGTSGPPPVSQWPSFFQPSPGAGAVARRTGFLEGSGTQIRVMNALLLREIQTRFGRAKLGYLWAFIEPVLHISVFYVLWSFRGQTTMDGLPLELFLITGFLPYFAFSQTYSGCVGAARQGGSMLLHPNVTPFDLLFVTAILEGLTRLTVFTLLLAIAWLVGIEFAVVDPGGIMMAFFMIWLIGFGLGCTIEAFSSIVITLPKVMTMGIRLLYFTSGVMFPITTMPPAIQELLFYNPLVHLIATIRYGFLDTPPLDAISLTFPFGAMIGLVTFGLIAIRALQRRLTSA